MQRNEISFKGQKIFIGIDVHKKTWAVSIMTESGFKQRFAQKASAEALYDFLKKHYPDGDFLVAYEAGFCGFSVYYALESYGIPCYIIHASDVPTTEYESLMKTDKIDADKLVKALASNTIHSIYIREKENLDDLAVLRFRKTALKELSAEKTRVKHLLHCNGVELPERFDKPGTCWSKAFIKWLSEDVKLLSSTRVSLDLHIDNVLSERNMLLKATRVLRELSRLEKYKARYELLTSIPGIGTVTAMCILVEIYDFNRFKNERQFASYLGLIPTCHNSGDKVSNGEMTVRGNKEIQTMLIEASWVAVRKDPALSAAFGEYRERMKIQLAIVRIARKLSNTIFAVLKNGKRYEPYKFK
jgi:transposase